MTLIYLSLRCVIKGLSCTKYDLTGVRTYNIGFAHS